MCLLVVASRVAEEEPLIIGANRDEMLDRPSSPMTLLEEGPPRVVGGRDELAGGTWLAVNEHGVCAGLTNQPLGEAKDPSKRSRGELPLALVRHRSAAEAASAFVKEFRPEDYNGAWLLVGDRTSLYFIDFTGPVASARPLQPGIHVLENRAMGEPSPKVDLAQRLVGSPTEPDEVVAAFRRVLVDHRTPDGDERPGAANCVHLEEYGTRSSCIVRVPADARPQLWVAPGPPCFAAYEHVRAPWITPARRAQSRRKGL
jgi:uncharacterized protein with NRDE domain